jgi:hypothetical protein
MITAARTALTTGSATVVNNSRPNGMPNTVEPMSRQALPTWTSRQSWTRTPPATVTETRAATGAGAANIEPSVPTVGLRSIRNRHRIDRPTPRVENAVRRTHFSRDKRAKEILRFSMKTEDSVPTNTGDTNDPPPGSLSRRELLTGGVAAAAFAIVPRHVLGGAGFVAPSEKITLACVGFGTQAIREIGGILASPDVQVVAVCDVEKDGAH